MTIPISPPRPVDPEHCPSPASDHKHSESWYDCKPCELCGDDSVPFACDCGRPSHGPGGAALATPLTVSIDVADDGNLEDEARDAGCRATRTNEFCMGFTSVYHVTGPKDLLLPLLEEWGYYEEGDYTIVEAQA